MAVWKKTTRVRGRHGVTVTEYAVLAGLIGALAIGTTLAIGLSGEQVFVAANEGLEEGVASAGLGGNPSGGGSGGVTPPPPPGPTDPVRMRVVAPSGLVELSLYDADAVSIDWGGASDCPTTPQTGGRVFITCSYAAPGTYDVSLGGRLTGFGFNNATMSGFASGLYSNIYVFTGGFTDTADRAEVESISDWGTVGLTRLDGMFLGADRLQSLPATLPATVMSLNYTFSEATSVPPEVASWNTGGVREMIGTFARVVGVATDVSAWDVSNVTHLVDTFSGSDYNPNIGGWDVSGVRVMNSVFQDNTGFNQDISGWNVTGVQHYSTPGLFAFGSLFSGASAFNQDLSTWCVDNDVSPTDEVGVQYYFDSGATSWVLPRPNWGAPC